MPYICLIKPKRLRSPRIFSGFLCSALFLSACGLIIGGCGRETQGTPGAGIQTGSGQSAISIPPNGFVRIVSRQIAPMQQPVQQGGAQTGLSGESLHYKWSLIGERNWQNPKADEHGFTLGDVYPLNSTTRRGGCNVWECDLSLRNAPTGGNWTLIIHGSNGQTAETDGVVHLQAGQKIEDVVRIIQTRDEPVALPTDVVLAKIGAEEVRLKVAQ